MQASKAGAQVQSVAPYAHHWRNITLKRRKQAQAELYTAYVRAAGNAALHHDALGAAATHFKVCMSTWQGCYVP